MLAYECSRKRTLETPALLSQLPMLRSQVLRPPSDYVNYAKSVAVDSSYDSGTGNLSSSTDATDGININSKSGNKPPDLSFIGANAVNVTSNATSSNNIAVEIASTSAAAVAADIRQSACHVAVKVQHPRDVLKEECSQSISCVITEGMMVKAESGRSLMKEEHGCVVKEEALVAPRITAVKEETDRLFLKSERASTGNYETCSHSHSAVKSEEHDVFVKAEKSASPSAVIPPSSHQDSVLSSNHNKRTFSDAFSEKANMSSSVLP